MSFHGIETWMILIGPISFESGLQDKKRSWCRICVECFLCAGSARGPKQLELLIALECFVGGWGPLQIPNMGQRTSSEGSIPSPFPCTNPKKPSQTPKNMLGSDTLKNPRLGFCRGLHWPWTRVLDFVVATLGPKLKTHGKVPQDSGGTLTVATFKYTDF